MDINFLYFVHTMMHHRDSILMYVILLVSAIVGVWTLCTSDIIMWDGSVYIGMGKWIFSNGMIGLWEPFRPPLFGLIQGLIWKFSLNPLFIGGILVIFATLLISYYLYKEGEKTKTYAGLFALVLFACMPLVMNYGHLAMTDIPSTLLAFSAILVLLRRRYVWTGVLCGLAFTMRFPQGLSIVVVGLSLLYIHVSDYGYSRLKELCKNVSFLSLGFLSVLIPFLISNYIFYGDVLLPMKEGAKIIGNASFLYDKGLWFYPRATLKNNPFLICLLFGAVELVYSLYKKRANQYVVIMSIALVVYFAYFTLEPHKELRYSLPFIPYAAALAGYGIAFILGHLKKYKILVYGIVFGMIGCLFWTYHSLIQPPLSYTEHKYYHFFDGRTDIPRMIATAPMQVGSADVLLVSPLYDSWISAQGVYEAKKDVINYVMLDSCVLEVACQVDTSCKDGKETMLTTLNKEGTLLFNESYGRCEYRIYEVQ